MSKDPCGRKPTSAAWQSYNPTGPQHVPGSCRGVDLRFSSEGRRLSLGKLADTSLAVWNEFRDAYRSTLKMSLLVK